MVKINYFIKDGADSKKLKIIGKKLKICKDFFEYLALL